VLCTVYVCVHYISKQIAATTIDIDSQSVIRKPEALVWLTKVMVLMITGVISFSGNGMIFQKGSLCRREKGKAMLLGVAVVRQVGYGFFQKNVNNAGSQLHIFKPRSHRSTRWRPLKFPRSLDDFFLPAKTRL
jgi:hypothetical protein